MLKTMLEKIIDYKLGFFTCLKEKLIVKYFLEIAFQFGQKYYLI